MSRLSPADLSAFLAVARHRSFRKAAVELGVSASALSHALRVIEARIDLRLFNRTTRSVALTEAGERLYARVSPAFRDIADAIEDLNALRGKPVGVLRLNAGRAAVQLALLPVVTRFLRAYPDVKVDITVDDALVDIVGAGYDAGLRFGETIAGDMSAIPIGPRQRSAVVATPEHFARYGVPQTPRDLAQHPCIRQRFPGGALYRWEFERGGMELKIEVDGPLTLTDWDLAMDAALAGNGVAYLFEARVQPLIDAGRLQRVLADWCPYYPGLYLYSASRHQQPAALKAFVDFIKQDHGENAT